MIRSQKRQLASLPFSAVLSLIMLLSLTTSGCQRVRNFGKIVGEGIGDIQIRKGPGDQDKNGESPVEFLLEVYDRQSGKNVPTSSTTTRPGEAVYVRVSLRNASNKSLVMQQPDASSIEFLLAGADPTGPIQVRPVFSKNEPMGEAREIKPGQALRRTFTFTMISKAPGACRLQGTYYITPRGVPSGYGPVFSQAVDVLVAGERTCRRDRDGILVEADAVEIAKRHLGRPVTGAKALLVWNQAGLLDWWVTLTIDSKGLKAGEPGLQAFFVSPYLAVVIRSRQARPYIPKPGDTAPKKPAGSPTPPAGK